MAYNPLNPNGQASMAQSQPVVIAVDQSPIQVIGSVQALNGVGISPADNISNTTFTVRLLDSTGAARQALGVGAYLFNGTNWDRQRGNSSVGAFVHVGAGSVITVSQSSIAVAIVSGSISATFTPPANQSVSGTVGASIIGTVPVLSAASVGATVSGGAYWGGIQNNSSILIGLNTVLKLGGDTLSSDTFPPSGTVLYNGASWDRARGTIGSGMNVSVMGIANISGSVIAFQGGTWSQSVVGQGAATALTNGWPMINGEASDSTGTFTNATQTTSVTNNNLDGYGNSLISINGVYGTATAIFEGSDDGGTTWYTVNAARDDLNVIETGYTTLTNVTRSWQINNSGFDSIRVRSTAVASGTVTVRISSSSAPNSSGATVGIGTALPAGGNMIGSIAAYQGTVPWAIAGSVAAFQAGTIISSIAGQVTVVSSIAGGIFPISGSVAAVVTNFPTTQNVSGSVVATQGTSPWVVNFQNSSIIAINAGSVIAIPAGSVITVLQAPSIVGTYAEDAPSASGDKGFLVMGARNDTLASVTSNDGDYSSHVVGPAGELIAANAPFTKWVQGTTSVLNQFGTSMATIAAQGTSIFTYVTGVQVANMGASSVLVTFSGATSSVIGYTIAPAGGGSNIVIPNAWKTSANGAFTASVSGASSVYISAEGFISKT